MVKVSYSALLCSTLKNLTVSNNFFQTRYTFTMSLIKVEEFDAEEVVKSEIFIDESLMTELESPALVTNTFYNTSIKGNHRPLPTLNECGNSQSFNSVRTKIITLPEPQRKLPESKLYRTSGNRVQHYRAAWERNPLFAAWLTRGSNSRRARCKVCNCEITSDITVLRYHARSKRHLASMKSYGGERTAVIECGPTTVKKGVYNPDWEKDVRYTSWIRPGSSNRFAYCRLCEEQIPAETAALRGHLATLKHLKSVEYDDQIRRISALGSESISLESAVNDESVLVHEISHCEDDDSATVQHTFERLSSAVVVVKDDRHEPLERLSFIIGKFLLKGEKMLKAVCAKCECVLLEDCKKQLHCVGCQYGLMDELKASNAEKSKARRAADAIPLLASSSCTTSDESQSSAMFKEETEDDVAEIHISEVEDSSPDGEDVQCPQSFGDGLIHDAAALRSEVQALVSTLQSRLTLLTEQLSASTDVDSCLDYLDTTVTALAKLKHLDDVS